MAAKRAHSDTGHLRTAEVPRSRRLEAWLPERAHVGAVLVPVDAARARALRAVELVTLREMPMVHLLTNARRLPALWGSRRRREARDEEELRPSVYPDRPLFEWLLSRPGVVLLEKSPDEVVVGVVGKLRGAFGLDPGDARTPTEFRAFATPKHDKLVLSIRTVPSDSRSLLVLEHGIAPARAGERPRTRRFGPALNRVFAFVGRSLLHAAKRRAERGRPTPFDETSQAPA
ncbi:MAG TPA: hypothetical protein VKY73_17280 [Polyangiaceae bacterium]|nr:hypothetical protein [Polyangiaceae bacterium]